MKGKMLVYTPFTGLGMYGGFRGNRWLKNRLTIFKQFVIPSLLNQTDRDFVHWISWREEERGNEHVRELGAWLSKIPNYQFVFTYSGCCLWDDKYEDTVARRRLFYSLRYALEGLFDAVPDCDEVYWLLQPSDDLYDKMTVESVKKAFAEKDVQAVAYIKGYICNYLTKEVREYNPETSPPFHAVKFPRDIFFDPGKHMTYISLKEDAYKDGKLKYPKGTPLPSHEYLGLCLKTGHFAERGFLVGCHGENISTHFNHPYRGEEVPKYVFDRFGISLVEPLVLPISYRKWLMRQLPHRWQRKLRYVFGERFYNVIYNYLRN